MTKTPTPRNRPLYVLRLVRGIQGKSGLREQAAEHHVSGIAHYNLDELLAQCDPSAEISEEDRAWLDGKPVGKELL